MTKLADMVRDISSKLEDERMIKCVFCVDDLPESLNLIKNFAEGGSALKLKWKLDEIDFKNLTLL